MATLPSASSALSAASNYLGQSNAASKKASGYASDIASTAGTLGSQANSLWGLFSSDYSGLLSSLPGKAEMPLSDYVNAAANDVSGNYDRSRGIQSRNMARMGVNPNSGRWQGMQDSLARAEAAARAGAMTNARITGQQQNWNRSMQAAGVGTQLANMSTSANSAAMSGYGQAAGIQSQLAGNYGNLANAAGSYGAYQSGTQQAGESAGSGSTGYGAIKDLGNGLGFQSFNRGSTSGGTVVRTGKKATTATQAANSYTAPYYINAGSGGAAGTGDKPAVYDFTPAQTFNGVVANTVQDGVDQNRSRW